MSRQDANAAFALSSFLQGTNAAYIDDLYARYEQDPASLDAATAGGRRQRGWGRSVPVRAVLYPVELAIAGAGGGDGLVAVAYART